MFNALRVREGCSSASKPARQAVHAVPVDTCSRPSFRPARLNLPMQTGEVDAVVLDNYVLEFAAGSRCDLVTVGSDWKQVARLSLPFLSFPCLGAGAAACRLGLMCTWSESSHHLPPHASPRHLYASPHHLPPHAPPAAAAPSTTKRSPSPQAPTPSW